MKKLVILFLLFTSFISAQKKDISLEDIWVNGSFRAQYMNALNTMHHGDFYTVLNFDNTIPSTRVDKYSYKTLEKVATLVDSKDLPDLRYFDNYTFSEDENLLVLGTDRQQIYRHSFLGKFYVYNIKTKQLHLVSENLIQEPTLSPDGKKIAYVFENNLYVKNLASNTTTQITTDGQKNSIINGITDWVYEEEFAFVRAFQWSGHSDKIAFMRFDESDVPEFTMMHYGQELYPEQLLLIWES
jgi:dipeptidyl-peptidase 4